jgi:GTP-binding protein
VCERRATPAARDGARAPEERSLTLPPPRFVGSFRDADIVLAPALPEVAVLGRSNVGKSSLLNALAGRRLAHVSTTPGKTRALNVYDLGGAYYLLDLPGYGYARASKTERAAFRQLIAHTLGRAHLAGVLWLLDIRRDPSAEDRALHDLFATRATRVLAALTKSDKLPRGQRREQERRLRALLELDEDQAIATSARAGEGIVELRDAITELIRGRAR